MNKKEVLYEFGKNLRAERNRNGLSQEGLGAISNISTRDINCIENGRTNTGIYNVIKIMKALNITFDKLYEIK